MQGQNFFEKIEAIKMQVRVLILLGTIVLLGGAFLWFVYLPQTEEIANTRSNIEDLNNKLRRAKIQRKKLPKLRAEMADLDARFKEALNILPNTKEIPELLRRITELGNNSGLDFRVFNPKKEKAREFYIEIPVAIEVRGGYHNVAVFFDKVGHMERVMNIENVSMKPIAPLSRTLITTCDAITYRFKGK